MLFDLHIIVEQKLLISDCEKDQGLDRFDDLEAQEITKMITAATVGL